MQTYRKTYSIQIPVNAVLHRRTPLARQLFWISRICVAVNNSTSSRLKHPNSDISCLFLNTLEDHSGCSSPSENTRLGFRAISRGSVASDGTCAPIYGLCWVGLDLDCLNVSGSGWVELTEWWVGLRWVMKNGRMTMSALGAYWRKSILLPAQH